jgi:hypothetical protein
VLLDGKVVRGEDDLRRYWGSSTADGVRRFRRRAALSAGWPAGGLSGADLLDTVGDPVARRYLEVSLHSDLATEPHLADARTVLDKGRMDVPGMVECYTLEGGMGRLAERLAGRIGDTRVELGARVTRVRACGAGRYLVRHRRHDAERKESFDAVVAALPVGGLGAIEWDGDRLRRTIGAHLARHERRGHYLRVSLLFARPFWGGVLTGSWFMVDAFGGACVYLESQRLDAHGYGVLGFLLAGRDALAMASLDDGALAEQVIGALPVALAIEARRQLLEARVHRWCGALSARPAARPDPEADPGLALVGDHLFDATLNGVYRSADLATDLLQIRARPHPLARAQPVQSATRDLGRSNGERKSVRASGEAVHSAGASGPATDERVCYARVRSWRDLTRPPSAPPPPLAEPVGHAPARRTTSAVVLPPRSGGLGKGWGHLAPRSLGTRHQATRS